MQINGRLEIRSNDVLLSNRGLQTRGKIQKYIDNECIRRMSPYTPFLTGMLEKSSTTGTVIGSGIIKQNAPYARFQYYGKVMVDSETGSAYAQKYGKKVLTEKNLQHNKSRHPKAGPFWFERMKSDHKDSILDGARRMAGAR